MAFVFYDSTADSATACGTGSATLLGVAPIGGYNPIIGIAQNNDNLYLRFSDSVSANTVWEVCKSVYNASTSSVSRGAVLKSSSATNARVNFTNPVNIYVDVASEWFTTPNAVINGDVTGSLSASSVTAIRGNVVAPNAPQLNQALMYRVNQWKADSVSASDLIVANINQASLSSIQSSQNYLRSSGVISNMLITSASTSANTITIASGQGSIRNSQTVTANIFSFDFAGVSAFNIAPNTTRFIGIDYDSGTPALTAHTSVDWNYLTDFPLGVVVNENGKLHILNDQYQVADVASDSIRFNYEVMPFGRDARNGGLIISESADNNRRVIVSAGAVWDRMNRYAIPSFSSATTPFTAYYRQTGAPFNFASSGNQSTWDNLHYDDNSGTLATLGANKFGVLWFYVEAGDAEIYCVYGRGNYNSQALAEAESVPSSLPPQLQYNGTIIGRIVFQKSATIASSVASTFNTMFSTSPVSVISMVGDLTGNSNANIVSGFQGKALLTDALVAQDVYYYDGTNVAHDNLNGDISGSITAIRVNRIKNTPIASTTATNDQIYALQGGTLTPVTINGDVTGSATALKTIAFRGTSLSSTAPTGDQIFALQNSTWTPVTIGGDASGSITALNVNKIRNVTINTALSSSTGNNYAMIYNANQLTLQAVTGSRGGNFYNGTGFSSSAQATIWISSFSGTILNVKAFSDATTMTVQVVKNSATNILSANYNLSASNTWLSASGLQNTTFVPNDYFTLQIPSISGTNPKNVAIQFEFTKS